MRRSIYLILLLGSVLLIILNVEVTTKQCIDYVCRTEAVPLYLKTLDFFDRHYNYEYLVKKIVAGSKNDEERVLQILAWTGANVRRAPQGLPVIDDHAWYIIVRGYGVNDQFQDVFTTLCNYAKIEAFFILIKLENGLKKPLSLVRLKNGWSVFDAYYGVYFKNDDGKIPNIKSLASGNWKAFSLFNSEIPDYYGECFRGLASIDPEESKLSRPYIQSPLNRFIFWNKNKK